MNLYIFSPVMTDSESTGHTFWMYKTLREHTPSIDLKVTSFGPENLNLPEVNKILKVGTSEHGPFVLPRKKTLAAISELIDFEGSKKGLFHFYDGGVGDLYVISKLMKKFSQSTFLLNFHWAHEVVRLFERRDFLSRLQVKLLSSSLKSFPPNLILAAESPGLANLCSTILSKKFVSYPVFSVYDFEHKKERDIDFVLVSKFEVNVHEILSSINELKIAPKVIRVLLIGIPEKLVMKDYRNLYVNLELLFAEDVLTREEYKEIHLRSRVLILPYTSSFYRFGSSGRLCDAAMLGLRVVVPNGLEITERAKDLGIGFPYQLESRHSLQSALCSAWLASREPIALNFIPDVENALSWMLDLVETTGAQRKSEVKFRISPRLVLLRCLGMLGWQATCFRRSVARLIKWQIKP